MRTLMALFLLCPQCFGVSPSITSFNAGQVSPLLEGRSDFQQYNASSRTIENMLVATQGPVFRRPGTKYIATQNDSTAAGRLIAFEQSTEDVYVLLFEDNLLSFFRDGAQIQAEPGTETMISGNQVAHWLLNDTVGLVAIDSTGNGHDGTTTVDVGTLLRAGQVGTGSFNIDGQYDITVADHDNLTFSDNNNDSAFSLSCWAFIEDNANTEVLLSKWRAGTNVQEWQFFIVGNRRLKLVLADAGTSIAGAVSEWDCGEDAATKTVADSVGANTGLLQVNNSEDITVTGTVGDAFNLNISDAVLVNDAANLSFGDGTDDSPFSITAWVFVENSNGSQVIMSKWDHGGGGREYVFYLDSLERLSFSLYDEDVNAQAQTSGFVVSTGWNFLSVTYSGVAGATCMDGVRLFVNGIRHAQRATLTGYTGTYDSMVNGTGKVGLGAYLNAGTPVYSFEAIIDNTVLWDVELSQSDIDALYNGGAGKDVSTSDPKVVISSRSESAIGFGWHFLSATYSAPADATAAADGIILYIDGEAVSANVQNNDAYVAMQGTAEEVRIGSSRNTADDGNTNYFSDRLDEISIYSKVLTPANITTLHSTSNPYTIPTPYGSEDLGELDIVKSEDAMFIAHPDYEPRQLTRSGHTTWALTAIQTDDGPFRAENSDTELTITPTGFTSIVTLTASEPIFFQGHVGSIWQIDQIRETSQVSGTFGENGNSLSSPFFSGAYGFVTSGNSDGTITLMRSTNGGVSWRPALTALTDADFDNPAEIEEDGAQYRAVMTNYGTPAPSPSYTFTITDNFNKGVVRITGVASGTVATAEALTDLVSGDEATSNWREGYWSDYRGWPGTVTIHQQRLTFANSLTFPQTIWFGKTDPDDYTNFSEGTLDTSAFTVALAGNNAIQWLLSQDYLLVGTSGSCGKYGSQGEAVTPTSPNYREQTRQGSAGIRGIIAGDAILYVERGSRKIREFVFDLQSDKYLSPDLSVMAAEITESGIKEVAYQFRPYPILWCVLNNGDIATLTYQKNQSVIAWTKQITDGDFESVVVIPDTTEDEVWVTVKRTIDGDTETVARYVEQFQPQDWGSDDNDAWFVDSGISYDGTPETDFTGADHLDGETVSIYADLLIESTEVVAAGAFTIDNAASRVLVGLPFTSKLETMPLVVDPQDKAFNKKIRAISFDFYQTGACKYGNGPDSTLENINFKNSLILDATATAQDLYTSVASFKRVTFPYGTKKKMTIYIETEQPMPLTVRSITPEYTLIGN